MQSFGNTQVSTPKESKSIGGQSYPEWAEIEKKIKANFAARRLEQIEKELVQRKEALPIDVIDEKNDDSKSESSSAGKAKTTSVYSESIKSKEASTIEKGHGKHKTTVLDFSEVEGTYFLPYEFCAKEIDGHQEQSDMTEQSLVNDEHQ